MPSKRSARSLFEDMLASMSALEEYVGGLPYEKYVGLREKRSAVEREFQILSEAAHRLKDDAEKLCPGQEWRNIRGIGNSLRHAYETIDHVVLWEIIHKDLPPLKAAVQATLAALPLEED